MRHAAPALAIWIASWCAHACAASWAESLFSELQHDFGTVPRGAERQHTFVITNTTDAPVRIAGMKRTCGCTQVTLDDKVVLDENIKESRERRLINPGEQARIAVVLDTRKFLGSKSADITVSFDQPRHSDVRLTINSFIRQDIVLNPGSIQFGTLSRGQQSTKELDIEYAGTADWRIQSVTSQDPNLDVTFDETYREPGKVGYKLKVAVKSATPPGLLRDVLTVETNDAGAPHVPVLVTGQVQPDLIVTPSTIALGPVKVGQAVSRQILLRGKQACRVTKAEASNEKFQIERPDTSQNFHKLTVRFAGSDTPGNFESTVRIETDLSDGSFADVKVSVIVTH